MAEFQCFNCGHLGSNPKKSWPPFKAERKYPRKVYRDQKEFDNTYHPGLESADLMHTVHGLQVSGPRVHPNYWKPVCDEKGNPKQLCHNCGWSSEHEGGIDGYTSRLKIKHIRYHSALWELGPNGPWMLRDETNEASNSWKADYMAQQFLRKEK